MHLYLSVRILNCSVVLRDCFEALARCSIGDGSAGAIIPNPSLATKFSAIGKYAYIILSDSAVDFGEVTCGEGVSREIVLQNRSVVPTDFTLVRLDNDRDEVFDIKPDSGTIPGHGEIYVTVKFKALAAGNFSEDRYCYRTPGNCDAVLTCRALATSPTIRLIRPDRSSDDISLELSDPLNAFNFGDSEVGNAESRIFSLANESSRNVSFSFMSDANSVFKISPSAGTIKAKKELSIKISFSPSRPINFYRRVFILIEDSLPQFVDLIGTGYVRAKGDVPEQRPFPLRFSHVQAFRNRSVAGIGHLSADELDTLYATRLQHDLDDKYFANVGRSGTPAMSLSTTRFPVTRSGESNRAAVAVAHEFFISDDDDSSREITLSPTSLDFGFAPHGMSSAPQMVTLTNLTNSKISVAWFVPKVGGSMTSEYDSLAVFSVNPVTADVEAKKSQVFSITFSSKQSNRNFVSEAEAIVYLKNQRTFRLVNDATMSPPWNLPLRLVGHTFSSGQLLASVKIGGYGVLNNKLTFPCTFVGESIFETIILENRSNLPAVFKASIHWKSEDHHGGFEENSFSIKPDCGQIDAYGFTHLCVRFSPHTIRTYFQKLVIHVNDSEGPSLALEGAGSIPYVCFPDLVSSQPLSIPNGLQGTIYIQPTSIGLSSIKTFELRNCSRLPLRFDITLPASASRAVVLSVFPSKGLLRGNQSVYLSIEFKPRKAKRIVYRINFEIYPVGGVTNKVTDSRQPGKVARPECVQALSVDVVAPGDIGAILFRPYKSSLSVQLIDTTQSANITLENVTDTDLFYELLCETNFIPESNTADSNATFTDLRTLEKEYPKNRISSRCYLICNAPKGRLPARSFSTVTFTFHPKLAGNFTFRIFAKLSSVGADGCEEMVMNNDIGSKFFSNAHGPASIDLPLMAFIHGSSSFPKVVFEDIRVDSDALIADVEQLWRQFSLSTLNYDLSVPINENESYMLASTTEDYQLKEYEFRFTPKAQYSSPETVYIQIRNHGSLPMSFHIHYPNEQELDLEPWVEEENPSDAKLMESAIINKLKCFSINPMKAMLAPNETCLLAIKYSFESMKYNGIHNLQLKFIIDQGRKFIIGLVGRTLPVDKSYNPKRASSLGRNISLDHILLVPFAEQNNDCYLQPVPIGLSSTLAPEQHIELVNVSEIEISYEVDIQAMDYSLLSMSHGQNISTIDNPKGVIKGLSSLKIKWRFYPLEAVLYDFPLIIRYLPQCNLKIQEKQQEQHPIGHISRRRSFMGSITTASNINTPVLSTQTFATMGCATIKLNMKCLGYDPRIDFRPKNLPFNMDYVGGLPPSIPLINMSSLDQPAQVSADFIDFGLIPIGSYSHSLFVLRNRISSYVQFKIVEPEDRSTFDMFTFSPAEGILPPNSPMLINFRCNSSDTPRLFFDRIKISICEILGDDVLSVSSTLFSRMSDRMKAGKVSIIRNFLSNMFIFVD